jgi:hypothetical protein
MCPFHIKTCYDSELYLGERDNLQISSHQCEIHIKSKIEQKDRNLVHNKVKGKILGRWKTHQQSMNTNVKKKVKNNKRKLEGNNERFQF